MMTAPAKRADHRDERSAWRHGHAGYSVFGEPDVNIKEEEGELVVELLGVDVYDPTTGEVRSSSTDDIACWFIDTNYNQESFFVRHAYFTGNDEPYKRLQRTLRAEIDEEAWSSSLLNRQPPLRQARHRPHRSQGHQPLRRRGPEGLRGGLMFVGIASSDFRQWGSFVLAAATLAFVAYDLWWTRRPRLRVRMRRYHDSDRLDVTLLNRGGGPLTVLNVYFEATPDGERHLEMQWAPDDGTLPVTISGLSAVDWHPELEGPRTLVLEGLPFGERFFWIPPPGWQGRTRRLRRRQVFGGVTREMRGQRRVPTPERPVRQR